MATNIQCNKQGCKYNRSEICTKKWIGLTNITYVSQHFWFACLDYSARESSEPSVQADGRKRCRSFDECRLKNRVECADDCCWRNPPTA